MEAAVGICANKMGIVPIPLLEILDQAAIELFGDQLRITHIDEITKEQQEPIWSYVAYESANYVNDNFGHAAVLMVLNRAIELSQQR